MEYPKAKRKGATPEIAPPLNFSSYVSHRNTAPASIAPYFRTGSPKNSGSRVFRVKSGHGGVS